MAHTRTVDADISELIGQTVWEITQTDDMMIFVTTAAKYTLFHSQDCCEGVYIEDVSGDTNDLLFSPLTLAECVTEDNASAECGQWTFYKFATIRGYVTVRWYGYYSVDVSFVRDRT